MKESRQKWMKNHTNISVTKDTREKMEIQCMNKESFDGLINRLLTGRTEKERKYSPILKQLSQDNELIQDIHNNAQKLRNICLKLPENTCYATATYVSLRKAGHRVSIKDVEGILGVSQRTITRYYRRLI